MATTELPDPDLAPYSDAQVRFAVTAWPMRAAEELRSALTFRALARAACQASIPEPWPARFAAAVHDEVRHDLLQLGGIDHGLATTVGRPEREAHPLLRRERPE